MTTDQITLLFLILLGLAGWFWYHDYHTRQQFAKRLTELQNLLRHTGNLVDHYRSIKLAIDFVYDGVVITDTNARVLYVNDSMVKMTGFSRREIIGSKVGKHWGGKMSPAFYRRLWHRIKVEKKPFLGEVHSRRKNGEQYKARLSIVPILDQRRKKILYLVAVERDQTPWKGAMKARTVALGRVARSVKKGKTRK